MLALCRAHGWPTKGYRLPEHPVQQVCAAELAEAAEVPPGSMPTAVDGCGVLTFALSLERMAFAFSRLAELDAGARVVAAMRAHPRLIRGRGATDTRLMELRDGWTAKGGAEGLFCAAGPGGTGIALKVHDGAYRGLGPALVAFLRDLGEEVAELAQGRLANSRGELVGEIVTER
jgi:L-asparaginase II